MECKLHNRYIYTERQSCHARTPRVLTHPRQEIIWSIHYFPDSTLSSVGGVGGESAIGAAGGPAIHQPNSWQVGHAGFQNQTWRARLHPPPSQNNSVQVGLKGSLPQKPVGPCS